MISVLEIPGITTHIKTHCVKFFSTTGQKVLNWEQKYSRFVCLFFYFWYTYIYALLILVLICFAWWTNILIRIWHISYFSFLFYPDVSWEVILKDISDAYIHSKGGIRLLFLQNVFELGSRRIKWVRIS